MLAVADNVLLLKYNSLECCKKIRSSYIIAGFDDPFLDGNDFGLPEPVIGQG